MIRKSIWLTMLPLAFFLGAGGCAKKTKPDEELPSTVPALTSAPDTTPHDSDSQNALGLSTIHFAYDSSVLDTAAKETLKSNVKILKKNVRAHVQIEGHCDQRGGTQYNLALGERRAIMVKKYLTVMGVGPKRVTTISMGKEKPLDTADTEEAYAKNRRANFVVTE
jgi:peptidoglycan-associated lipoprotein